MRMKRPQGYKHIRCPHCGEKIRIVFRTLHRLKVEVEGPAVITALLDESKDVKDEEGDYRG